jgi:hypothetical protein
MAKNNPGVRGKNPIKWPGYSKDTVTNNIRALIDEGRTQKQAVAIAIHSARQAYRHKYPTRAWPHWLKPMVQTNPLKKSAEESWLAVARAEMQGDEKAAARLRGQAKSIEREQKTRAAKLFKKFTGHEGAVVKTITVPALPKAVAVIGKIDGILYETVRDGVTERYRHTFKKNARPLFCVTADGRQIVLIGGSYNFTERGIVDRSK